MLPGVQAASFTQAGQQVEAQGRGQQLPAVAAELVQGWMLLLLRACVDQHE